MIISVTERGTFKRCTQKWMYESRNTQGLTPIMPPQALGFGTLVHKTLEEWTLRYARAQEDEEIDPQEILIEVAAQTIKEIKERYFKAVGAAATDAELDGVYENIDLANHIIENYAEYWGSPIPDGYELVAPEQTVLTPIPGTMHVCTNRSHYDLNPPEVCPDCGKHGPEVGAVYHFLEATLDVLVRNPAGLLFVVDHKTYGQRPKLETLETNDQFLAYMWTVSKLGLGDVGGFIYDGMWKRRREGKRTLDDLFTRHVITRAPQEFVAFERELAREANLMAMTFERPDEFVTRNFQWQGCWDCTVKPLCLAEYRGEDAGWVRGSKFTTREGAEWLTEDDEE